jgi:predicted metalloprotease with PDZ domain
MTSFCRRAHAPAVFFLSILATVIAAPAHAQGKAQGPAPIEYRLSFADAVHHVMQVEVTFRDLPAAPLKARMSRSSPGRYAAHDFAKNLFQETIADGQGRPLTATRPNPHEWDIAGHDGTVKVTYRLFGDRIDGTYLAVDGTHAHMNGPATLLWAKGLESRAARITLVAPAGSGWTAATQLYATPDPFTFTAPNLQYLMDSPIEFGVEKLRTFTVPGENGSPASTFRVSLHHTGTDAELDAFTRDIEKVVREQRAIIGEFPDYEPGSYTFLIDYLPWSGGDGMEHRNSTVISGSGSLAQSGRRALGTVSHEFFHNWNVERIRPASLEPFNFEDANISGELWLAEGFTNYYGKLALIRAGLIELPDGVTSWAGPINGALLSPGTKFRSAVDMSRLAPFVDAATSIDPTYWTNTQYSYYPFGESIALGLDLTLRARSNGKVTLDDYMRAMWKVHGKPGGPAPGLVGKPYTLADARARLAEASGDAAFAADFFTRYIEGTERIDYAPLLLQAGFVIRKANAGQPTMGMLPFDHDGASLKLTGSTAAGSPAYAAGLDRGDELLSVAGTKVASLQEVQKLVGMEKPGATLPIVFLHRGQEVQSTVTLGEDERLAIVPIENTDGGTLTAAQKAFRDAWLSSKVK